MNVEHNNLHVFIRYSKTDQTGRGVTLHVKGTNKRTCPVRALVKFTQVRAFASGSGKNGPLFCHIDGSSLTRYQFSAVLKKALGVIGGDYSRYQSHSFRIGAATTAAAMGLSVDEIKRAGRWRSDAF